MRQWPNETSGTPEQKEMAKTANRFWWLYHDVWSSGWNSPRTGNAHNGR